MKNMIQMTKDEWNKFKKDPHISKKQIVKKKEIAMKGFINKVEKGWVVAYVEVSNPDVGTIIKELPLHPYNLQEFIELSERFDNLEARIFANPKVDFTIVEECFNYHGTHFGIDCGCKEGFVQYAKINTYGL